MIGAASGRELALSAVVLAAPALLCFSTEAAHMEESIQRKFFRLLGKGFSSNV